MEQGADRLLELIVVLAAATLGAGIFERLRLPAIAGFLAAGAIVGPGGFALVQDPEQVRSLAELGVALLLFEIGLELPLDALRRTWRSALVSGALQVLATLAVVTAVASALGTRAETALVLGMLVAMSSTALVMRVLAQQDEVDAPHGRLALGILLFQDFCIVPFLLAVPILAGEGPRDPIPLTLAIGRAVLALAVLFAAARFLLPSVLERVARLRSAELFSLAAFLLALGSAVAAEQMGIGAAVGAFIAGLVVSASPYARQLFAEVAPLRGVLLGTFFTAVGMLLEPAQALAAWPGVALYVGVVVLLKAAIVAAVVAGPLRAGVGVAVRTGLALAQTGEFSFVLAVAAGEAGLLGPPLDQVFVAGSVLTLVATPFLIRASGPVARWLGELAPGPAAEAEPPAGHVLIVGFGFAGRSLARVLRASGIPYRVLEANPLRVADARRRQERIAFGDATRPAILEHLGVRAARLVCVAINDPQATRTIVEVTHALAPDVPLIARTRYVEDLDRLVALGANEVVAEEYEATLDFVSRVLRRFGTAESAIDRLADELRSEGYELLRAPTGVALDPWLAEILGELSSTWVEVPASAPPGRSIAELAVRKRTGVSILAVRRRDVMHPNPTPEFRLEPGDSLLVLGGARSLEALAALLAGGGAS
jgi:CPA2 family monovalent cation:H+ antiporter-2